MRTQIQFLLKVNSLLCMVLTFELFIALKMHIHCILSRNLKTINNHFCRFSCFETEQIQINSTVFFLINSHIYEKIDISIALAIEVIASKKLRKENYLY